MISAFGKNVGLRDEVSSDEAVDPFNKAKQSTPKKVELSSEHEESILGNVRGHGNEVFKGKWTVDNIF